MTWSRITDRLPTTPKNPVFLPTMHWRAYRLQAGFRDYTSDVESTGILTRGVILDSVLRY